LNVDSDDGRVNRRTVSRAALAALVVVSAAFLGATNAGGGSGASFAAFQEQAALPADEREPLAAPRNGTTVVTSHLGDAGDIVAVGPDGTVRYHDDARDGYWDVDPSPAGRSTVVYSATDEVHDRSECRPLGDNDYCVRQVIERANLSTGETTVLYSRVDPRYHNSEWHDVDRINASHYLVADMYANEVFVVDVRSRLVTWEWSVQSHFPLDGGGPYPTDWAHLNDVELLDDGRVVVSLRNQDQVVLVEPGEGVVEEWTLGSDGDHDILYEQHNPDYIPASDGGPALLVADSENNRIVERLPNGHTLVTDTAGGRVVELDRDGEVVWQLGVATAYEAERLTTGDESAGGPSAERAGLASSAGRAEPGTANGSGGGSVLGAVKAALPNKLVNGVTNGTPLWMGFYDAVAAAVLALAAVGWLVCELWWAGVRLRTPVTRV
jgi:hypothetical protein